jgi:hypothetical protein
VRKLIYVKRISRQDAKVAKFFLLSQIKADLNVLKYKENSSLRPLRLGMKNLNL